jgi:predicted amidohydrolase
MLNTISIARCFEYGIVFVLCNPAHESKVERKQPFGPMIGNTQIAVPFKGPIAHCNHRREEMIIADVDIKAITDDSEVFHKIRKDWDEGLVYDERAQSRL